MYISHSYDHMMESNFVHVLTMLLASVYCNMLLLDVFGQTFVMLFPFRGWLLSPKQLQLADLLMKLTYFGFAGIMLLIFIEVLGLTDHERWIG